MKRTIVTTSHKPEPESMAKAWEAAAILGSDFVVRERMSLEQLRKKHGAENVLVINRGQIVLHTLSGEYFFHPSMSVPRIKALKQGKPDHMVDAMGLQPGFKVLDCTLGLGSDAIVAAFAVGAEGCVTGIETAPELAYIVKEGLLTYRKGSLAAGEAMSRITVICEEALSFLQSQPDESYDVVYFDPMFRVPRTRSSSMQPLRGIVNSDPLTREMIDEALRVSRYRVVMKENEFSTEFARLGFIRIIGGKYSPVAFGIIEKQEAGI